MAVNNAVPQGDAACPMLEWHDLTVAYGRRPVLWNVDLDIQGPCLFGIIGPNGAGKSTLLKASLDLVRRAGGTVRFWGQRLSDVRSKIAYVPQRETVDWDFPVSVMDVVRMGATSRLTGFSVEGNASVSWRLQVLIALVLPMLQIDRSESSLGGSSSGSFWLERLAREATIYLLDEPMAGVDAGSQEQIFNILTELRDQGKLVVAVHHDIRTAAEWFDAVALVDMHTLLPLAQRLRFLLQKISQ